MESADRVQLNNTDLSSQCAAKASTPLADVSVTNDSDRHSRDWGSNSCRIDDVKNRCPTGLARAVGVIEEGLGTCIIAGNHRNAQREMTQRTQSRGRFLGSAAQGGKRCGSATRIVSHANKMRTVIQQVLIVFREEVAGECFFLLPSCVGVGEDLQSRAAQCVGNIISGLTCVPKDAHLSSGLGKHQSKCSGLRFQNQGEADAAAREEVGNAANCGLGDGHERTGPRDALGILGATQN